MQSLAERNGCQSEPASLPVTGSASAWRYRGRTNNADVLFYAVAGGGHSWPGGKEIPTFLVGKTTPDVDATRLMWNFFQHHPMTPQTK